MCRSPNNGSHGFPTPKSWASPFQVGKMNIVVGWKSLVSLEKLVFLGRVFRYILYIFCAYTHILNQFFLNINL